MSALRSVVKVSKAKGILCVTLNRPDRHNAFDADVVYGLTRAFRTIRKDVRAVVLQGEGASFCAGADLRWMQDSRSVTPSKNLSDAWTMAEMYLAVDECPVPVIARIQGRAAGGGAGLVACSDIAIAEDQAVFAFGEVRVGLVPAVISAFLLPKIGTGAARRYFLTGDTFTAREALTMGLIHEAVSAKVLDRRIEEIAGRILGAGPRAVREAKALIRKMAVLSRDKGLDHAVRTIARLRRSPEGQEGLAAFLERRSPRWL